MPNRVKNLKIWLKVKFFAFFGMEFKKFAKICKNEKMQHLIRFYVQKAIQNKFLELLSIFSPFQTNVANFVCVCDFLKNCELGQNLTLPMCSL